jgi:hypothetical protein
MHPMKTREPAEPVTPEPGLLEMVLGIHEQMAKASKKSGKEETAGKS